jgi:hypothetical protein
MNGGEQAIPGIKKQVIFGNKILFEILCIKT